MLIEGVLENKTLNATRVFQENSLNPKDKSHVSARTISRTLKSRGLIDSTDLAEHINEDCMEERLTFATLYQYKVRGSSAFISPTLFSIFIEDLNEKLKEKTGIKFEDILYYRSASRFSLFSKFTKMT